MIIYFCGQVWKTRRIWKYVLYIKQSCGCSNFKIFLSEHGNANILTIRQLLSFDLIYLFWFYNSLLYFWSALSSLSLKQIVILAWCFTFLPSFLVVTCPEPDVPEDGYVVGYDFNIHSTIEYHCESGYQLVGKNMLECSAQGEWNDEPPTCQCKCCSFPWVFNVQHVN